MTLRQMPGALLLGLLASLAAHALAFGQGHTEGGAYHGFLMNLALCGAGTGLCAAMLAAFGRAPTCAQGSILACRLAAFVPGVRVVAASGLAWFAAIESFEPAHAGVSLLVVAAGMLLAALALRHLALFVLRLLAQLALSTARPGFAMRAPFVLRRAVAPAFVPARIFAPHHVTRPPPALSLLPA